MLLVTLHLRAMESQRPDALIKDEKAVALVARLGDDIERIKGFPMTGESIASAIRRSQEFDRHAQDFLGRHPEAVVVHVGCGLDSRFERVCSEQPDNGQVEWYDLDFPDVIALRRPALGCTHSCSACSRLFCPGRAAL